MDELLKFTMIVEADRLRLARFAVNTVKSLGGDTFRSTAALASILPRLRQDHKNSGGHLQSQLVLKNSTLYLEWGDSSEPITQITDLPDQQSLQNLRADLREASESTDPELLKQRNQRITEDLDEAREQASMEVADLEKVLEIKKQELQLSIELAQIDSLTGLFNRGAFDVRLRELFLRSKRQREELCLIMLDLDNFKQVNDTHGHQHGDETLKRIADAMRAATREHVDYPCRMGGDEFAIIACTNSVPAQRIARNILEAMNSQVSIGVAEMLESDTIESLIGRADAALYEVKRNGRGDIAVADEEMARDHQDEQQAS